MISWSYTFHEKVMAKHTIDTIILQLKKPQEATSEKHYVLAEVIVVVISSKLKISCMWVTEIEWVHLFIYLFYIFPFFRGTHDAYTYHLCSSWWNLTHQVQSILLAECNFALRFPWAHLIITLHHFISIHNLKLNVTALNVGSSKISLSCQPFFGFMLISMHV